MDRFFRAGKNSRAHLDKLNCEIVVILKLPDVREKLAGLGVEFLGTTAQEPAAVMRTDAAKWEKVFRPVAAQAAK